MKRLVVSMAMFGFLMLTALVSRADCLTDAVGHINGFRTPVTLTIVNGGNSWVGYVPGSLFFDTNTQGNTFNTSLYYSDRVSGDQHFLSTAPDSIWFSLTTAGALHFHSNTWNADADLTVSCVAGTTLATAVSGDSIWILSFGPKVQLVP